MFTALWPITRHAGDAHAYEKHIFSGGKLFPQELDQEAFASYQMWGF